MPVSYLHYRVSISSTAPFRSKKVSNDNYYQYRKKGFKMGVIHFIFLILVLTYSIGNKSIETTGYFCYNSVICKDFILMT